jgi:hypothetical protein
MKPRKLQVAGQHISPKTGTKYEVPQLCSHKGAETLFAFLATYNSLENMELE